MIQRFITGSGTEVGKTLVTAALCHQLEGDVVAHKPLVSGIEDLEGSDPGILLRALGREVSEANVAEVSPVRFQAPLSPDHAAAREGRTVEVKDLLVEAEADVHLIEGVGGVMVPLNERETVLDWIEAVGAPAVVVTGSYLGALSHTLTCLEVLRARGVEVAGVVVSESVDSVDVEDTLRSLRAHTRARVEALPRLSGEAPWTRAPDLRWLVSR
jgi:dethiobiotin synthetase